MANFLERMFTTTAPSRVVSGVYRIQTAFVNAYMVGEPDGPWVLVDTGMPFSVDQIKKAVDDTYGVQARPEAIVMTHGHFDHAGTVEELSRYWDVPVYAHPLEIPYLTGQSAYPPQDPTVGGFGGQLSRFYPNEPVNISERIHQLAEDGSVPGMEEWKWLHTPGHTPGHISLFREKDAVLIAGDAFITMNMHDMSDMLSGKPELMGPPEYFTSDWTESLRSIDKLVALRPKVVATGHGKALQYPGLELDLIDFADRYLPPRKGRYVDTPAHSDATGVVSLPAPVSDPLPKIVAGAAAGILAAVTTFGIMKNKNSKKEKVGSNRRPMRPVVVEKKKTIWGSDRSGKRKPLEKERKLIYRSTSNRRAVKQEEEAGRWWPFGTRKERMK